MMGEGSSVLDSRLHRVILASGDNPMSTIEFVENRGLNLLQDISEEDFFDLTWEYILRCKQDNIVHTEIFFDPQSHLPRGVSFETIINGIDKALKKAEKDKFLVNSYVAFLPNTIE